jgi:hypothetical protein
MAASQDNLKKTSSRKSRLVSFNPTKTNQLFKNDQKKKLSTFVFGVFLNPTKHSKKYLLNIKIIIEARVCGSDRIVTTAQYFTTTKTPICVFFDPPNLHFFTQICSFSVIDARVIFIFPMTYMLQFHF